MVNGQRYYQFIGRSGQGVSIGSFTFSYTKDKEQKTIYYNPNNPKEIRTDLNSTVGYIFCIVGLLAIIGFFFSKKY